MPSLKSLQTEIGSLSEDVLQFFGCHGILTLEDFVRADISTLKLNHGSGLDWEERDRAIENVMEYVWKNCQKLLLCGNEMLTNAKNLKSFSTGCKSLDGLLYGGIKQGAVTELVGPSSSGKSQVCLQVAARVSLCEKSGVIYVDSSNSFCAQRIAHIIGRLVGSREHLQELKFDVSQAMRFLIRFQIFDIHALLELLHTLHRNHLHQKQESANRVKLLVIDSLSLLISPVLGGSHGQGHSLMVGVARMLKKLAADCGMAVLVTSHTVGAEGGSLKPALGESWKSTAHVRAMLSRDSKSDMCSAHIDRHCFRPSGGKAKFRISKTGVEDVG